LVTSGALEAPLVVSMALQLDEDGRPSHRRPVNRASLDDPSPPSRQGLTEVLLLVGFLALAAGGAVAVFGGELRQVFGAQPASAPAPPNRSP